MLENTNGQSISNALVYFRWKHSYFDSKMTHFEPIIAYWTISGYFEEIEIEIRILKSLWNSHDRFLSKTEPVYTGLNDHVIFHV